MSLAAIFARNAAAYAYAAGGIAGERQWQSDRLAELMGGAA